MLYVGKKEIDQLGLNFNDSISYIEKAMELIYKNDYAQPIKPYLRYGDMKNRIIAMPAFVGGDINLAGIKWIASFPNNIKNNIPRAHSVVILNEAATGIPISVINTPYLSILRTASVSGTIIKHYREARNLKNITIGIIGWGPIGKAHYQMVKTILGSCVKEVRLYDIRDVTNDEVVGVESKIRVVNSWEEAYLDSDIVFHCTVSDAPYVDKKPKKGALLMNVSLRDYKPEFYDYIKDSTIIVDDWEEVCREDTDIEYFHKLKGLQMEDTVTVMDVIVNHRLNEIPEDQCIMFNPMGMAVFDVTMGRYIYDTAVKKNIGTNLE